jgi:mRNA interferase MazF
MIEARPSNGLRFRSQVMTDKMIALRQDRIRRVIDHIDTETSEHLDRALLLVLGLAGDENGAGICTARITPPILIGSGG